LRPQGDKKRGLRGTKKRPFADAQGDRRERPFGLLPSGLRLRATKKGDPSLCSKLEKEKNFSNPPQSLLYLWISVKLRKSPKGYYGKDEQKSRTRNLS